MTATVCPQEEYGRLPELGAWLENNRMFVLRCPLSSGHLSAVGIQLSHCLPYTAHSEVMESTGLYMSLPYTTELTFPHKIKGM